MDTFFQVRVPKKINSVLMAGNKTSVIGPLLVGVRRSNFRAIYARKITIERYFEISITAFSTSKQPTKLNSVAFYCREDTYERKDIKINGSINAECKQTH